MTVHLMLLSVSRVKPKLEGACKIYSDCLRVLARIAKLSLHRIPSRCRHSDILKNIMVNCSNLAFTRTYMHVDAHQDNEKMWDETIRPAQLNTVCNIGDKMEIYEVNHDRTVKRRPSPLEPICIVVSGTKITLDAGPEIRYVVQRALAKEFVCEYKILFANQFEDVVLSEVYDKLSNKAPALFALCSCKQVMELVETNDFLPG